MARAVCHGLAVPRVNLFCWYALNHGTSIINAPRRNMHVKSRLIVKPNSSFIRRYLPERISRTGIGLAPLAPGATLYPLYQASC